MLALISLTKVYADELTLPFPGTEQAIAVDNNIDITTNNHKSFEEDFKEYYAQQQLRQKNLADVTVNNNSDLGAVANSEDNTSNTVPKPFAAVVNLLRHNNSSSNESSTPITCHYSQTQQKSFTRWQKKYPQLKSIPASCQTAMIDKLRTSESISQLIGVITNSYGIRDDIFESILLISPLDNYLFLKAAIKTAYYDNLSSYALTNTEKIATARKGSLSERCMVMFDGSGPDDTAAEELWYRVSKMSSDALRDTVARDNYQRNLDQTVFAWQLLGYDGNEKLHCKRGDY